MLFFVLLGCHVSAQSSAGWKWARSSGGTGRDEAELPTVDHRGNVIICGKFSDTAWFGTTYLISSGLVDMYITKYDSAGVFLWARKGGNSLDAEGLSIAADLNSGNIAVTGYFKGSIDFGTKQLIGNAGKENFFVAVYDTLGNLSWAEQATGGNIRGKGVEFDPWGNVLVTGQYEDSAMFGTTVLPCQGLQNAFLVKYDPSGTFLWANYGGGQYNAWASSVGIDSQGNAYITGAFKDTANFGTHVIITFGVNDVFLAKCSPAGSWIWAAHAGGTSDDYGNGIEVDVYDHIAVTGSFYLTVNFPPAAAITSYGSKDGFIAYYDPGGNCLWAHPFGGTGEDKGIGVSTDNIGNVYVTGFIKTLGNFGPIQLAAAGIDDVCLVKYSSIGTIFWACLAGGAANDYGKGVQVDMQGVAYVAGYYEGTASFGSTSLTSKGGRESYVAKYHDGSPLILLQPKSQTHCVGDTFALFIDVTGSSLVYAWYKDGVLVPGQNTNTYTIYCQDTLPTGKYHCTVSSISGYVVSDTAWVQVYSLPVIDLGKDTTIYQYSLITLDAGAGYTNYLWSTGDTTHSITYFGHQLHSEVIKVTVTTEHGCIGTAEIRVVVIVSVEEPADIMPEAILSPNPAREQVHIVCNVPVEQVEIISMEGKIHSVYRLDDPGEKTMMIGLDNYKKGLYFIRIHTSHGLITRKIVLL